MPRRRKNITLQGDTAARVEKLAAEDGTSEAQQFAYAIELLTVLRRWADHDGMVSVKGGADENVMLRVKPPTFK